MFAAPKASSSVLQESVTETSGANARSNATRPASMTTPDSIALMPLGACECASGSQVCIGTNAAFTPKPIRNSAPATHKPVGALPALPCDCATNVRIWSRPSAPVCANTSAIPSSTRMEPAALCTRYFTPASNDAGCSW